MTSNILRAVSYTHLKIFYHQIKEEGLEGGCDAKELVCEADLKMQAIAELEAELSKI